VDKPEECLLKTVDYINFVDQDYQITNVRHLVNQNMRTIQHVCFVFSDVPSDKLSSSIYLTPTKMPEIKKGMMITYHEQKTRGILDGKKGKKTDSFMV